MENNISLQDKFISILRDDQSFCVVHLVNGVKLRGVIKQFDMYVILLEWTDREVGQSIQIIYKHAISTIAKYNSHIDKEESRQKTYNPNINKR